ncbi:MAG: hypothetical protein OIF55_08350 [Amphritea sp.]|nr:hypothetical protein [Amphritea sp.]
MILDVFVIVSVGFAIFSALNGIFVAQGGVKIADKYFEEPVNEWEKHYPPDCYFRFNFKYCFKFCFGVKEEAMPLHLKIWMLTAAIGNLSLMGWLFAGGVYKLLY